jgi:hypothetical protein
VPFSSTLTVGDGRSDLLCVSDSGSLNESQQYETATYSDSLGCSPLLASLQVNPRLRRV